MMLADAVQAAEGKLYILGGGWNVSGQAPFGIAVLIEVPWTEANRGHRWQLHLETEDGEPVAVGGSIEPVTVGGDFEVGRPAGVPPGTPFNVPVAINSGPLPLEPGRYTWRLMVDGESDEDWYLSFDVRAPASPAPPV
jgi:hypothetical protein